MAMSVAMISIQSGASLAKQLFPAFGGAGTAAIRILFAALLLALWFRPWKARTGRDNWRSILLYGLSLVAMNTSFYMAIERIPLGVAVAIEFLGPLCVTIASSRKMTDGVWTGLAVGGLALLAPWGQADTHLDPMGVALALCAALCWALYILFARWAGREHGTQAVSLGMIVAAVVALPVAVTCAGPELFHPRILALALLVALLSSAIPYGLEMIGLRHLPAVTFGILLSLEPAVSSIAGYIFLGEALTVLQWTAVAAIMAASAGAAITTRAPELRDAP